MSIKWRQSMFIYLHASLQLIVNCRIWTSNIMKSYEIAYLTMKSWQWHSVSLCAESRIKNYRVHAHLASSHLCTMTMHALHSAPYIFKCESAIFLSLFHHWLKHLDCNTCFRLKLYDYFTQPMLMSPFWFNVFIVIITSRLWFDDYNAPAIK